MDIEHATEDDLQDIEHATEDDLQDIKKWFFKENMRIQQEKTVLTEAKAAFEAEKKDYEEQHEMARLKIQMVRRQLDKEKRLFDLKWKKLEEEVYRLALEKDDIAKARKELAAMEKRHISRVLEYTKGNKTEAARLLKIGLTTLYRKIEEYGL